MARHRSKSSLAGFALAIALLTPTAHATFITLNDFESVSLTSLPVACAIAYNTYISDCGLSDFTNGKTCSADCVDGIEDIQQTVQDACTDVRAKKRSVLGMALRGKLVQDLCPNNDDDDEPTATATGTGTTPAPVFSTLIPGTTTTVKPTTTEASAPESTDTDALASPTTTATETSQPTSAEAPARTTAAGDDQDNDNGNNNNNSGDNGGGGTVGLNPENDSAGTELPARWASRLAVGAALVVGIGLVR